MVMIILRILHNFLFYLYTIISFFAGTAITLCFALFSKDKIAPFQTAAHVWAKFLIFFSGVKVRTRGLENIPTDKASILVSNHQGAADIPILLAYLPVRFRFAIKKELFSIPFFGWYLRRADYFPVEREMIFSAYKMVNTVVNILNAGGSVLIFPEGTRSRTGSLGEFKRGSLMAALKSGAPVVPISISGSYDILPRGSWLFKPAKVTISVGKPVHIKSEEEYDRKVKEIRDTIAEML